ncbi:hypothetical protein PsAD5_03078 [Pseudovibrio sp. Ad5]|uniref:hypothetical protein n=2 Tax=unclassified Pseudovibrio TaxID=2627060 RepID=UPI0007AE9B9D|nr:hypothetical protein [Pseudovibrio sp. Ad5]KZK93363.1 hypothetical protein PsAD5_03078 [Pseudovibrio sp. Ad5]
MRRSCKPRPRIDFKRIARAALLHGDIICRQWLPGGRLCGCEYTVKNPRRMDRRAGSFKINIASGLWCDFATGEGGRDFISLGAYLFSLSQKQAACNLADMIGVDAYE